jgi:peroxiredoxin
MLTDGSKAPKIELLDQNGKKFSLASLGKTRKPILLVAQLSRAGCATLKTTLVAR